MPEISGFKFSGNYIGEKSFIRDYVNKILWILIGGSIGFAIIYSSVTFVYPFKQKLIQLSNVDWLIHFFSYGLVMYCFGRSWRARKIQIIIAVLLMVLSTALEFFQCLESDIKAIELDDISANNLGILAGYFLSKSKKE